MKLVAIVLQQSSLGCLVNPTVRSSLIELQFGRGIVDLFILDLYGGISLWLPESLRAEVVWFLLVLKLCVALLLLLFVLEIAL